MTHWDSFEKLLAHKSVVLAVAAVVGHGATLRPALGEGLRIDIVSRRGARVVGGWSALWPTVLGVLA
jgi:hypothetical protein